MPRRDYPFYDLDDKLIGDARLTGTTHYRVYRVDRPMIVLGRGSDAAAEVNMIAAKAGNVPIYRRRGGGCTVYLDPGNVVVSLAAPMGGIGDFRRHFDDISRWIIAALARVGVDDVRHDGISDLARGSRKVGGSCIHRAKDLLYYTTTLLIRPDLDAVERYLAHPPKEPGYRRGRRHRDFMGRLPIAGNDIVRFEMELTAALGEAELDLGE
ncbi:hypothetical protein KDL45_08075 [bacterium]|nr:hypothetical protein [bacterium]